MKAVRASRYRRHAERQHGGHRLTDHTDQQCCSRDGQTGQTECGSRVVSAPVCSHQRAPPSERNRRRRRTTLPSAGRTIGNNCSNYSAPRGNSGVASHAHRRDVCDSAGNRFVSALGDEGIEKKKQPTARGQRGNDRFQWSVVLGCHRCQQQANNENIIHQGSL